VILIGSGAAGPKATLGPWAGRWHFAAGRSEWSRWTIGTGSAEVAAVLPYRLDDRCDPVGGCSSMRSSRIERQDRGAEVTADELAELTEQISGVAVRNLRWLN
jgi:hypothetical protein